KEEKAAKLAAKAAATRAKLDAEGTGAAAESAPAGEDPKKALIAAALARAKAQKAASEPKNTDNLTPATQAEIDAIEARRQATQQAPAGADATPGADAR